RGRGRRPPVESRTADLLDALGRALLLCPPAGSRPPGGIVRQAQLPGSQMIPAEQALRTLLALKLIGKERKSHVMDLVDDQGIALFAGLNVVPKRSYLAAYSSQIDDRTTGRLMAAWFTTVSD